MDNLRKHFDERPPQKRSMVIEIGFAAAVLVLLALFVTWRPGASPDTVTITAHMSPFSQTLVQPGTLVTSTLSSTPPTNFNPPPPSPDEGSLTDSYAWSAIVLYSQTPDGSFTPAPAGSYTIKPAPAATSPATLNFIPLVTAFWEVSVKCSVTVTDSKNKNLLWSGSATSGQDDLTSATVSLSPSAIVTGASLSKPGSIMYKGATATVQPMILAGSVQLNDFINNGSGRAEILDPAPNIGTGVETFNVAGTAGSSSEEDITLQARLAAPVSGTPETFASSKVTVVIPKAIGTPHPQVDPGVAVAPKNVDLYAGSIPAWQGVPPGDVLLGTLVETSQSIPVVDQFGKALSSVYNGQIVYEHSGSAFVAINVKIENGKYQDHVGFEQDGGVDLPPTKATAIAWPTSTQHYAIASPQSKPANATVQVAGFTLNPSITSRTVSYSNGVLTVTWP